MLSPLYGQLSPLRIPTNARINPQPIIAAYIAAVEAADGQSLEQGVKNAYSDFITGCVNDDIWTSLKASCILAGARTINGALVPLVGSAPTNNNFVSADYLRKTGLKGSATKYLNSNRANNLDPQNSKHISLYQTERCTGSNIIGMGNFKATPANRTSLTFSDSILTPRVNNSFNTATNVGAGTTVGLKAGTRFSATQFIGYRTGNSVTQNANSSNPSNLETFIFASNSDGSVSAFYNGRLSFYSIGEHIDLAALDTRVSTLMTALAAAIP
jgi:hypothetical protein